MTPKEKAKELVDKFIQINGNAFFAKECALVAVDEIYKLRMNHGQYLDYDLDKVNYYSYWEEVKQEIEKL